MPARPAARGVAQPFLVVGCSSQPPYADRTREQVLSTARLASLSLDAPPPSPTIALEPRSRCNKNGILSFTSETERMKIAHFDCFSGISGDMVLGALVDSGADLRQIEKSLRQLNVPGWKISAEKVKRRALAATQVKVETGRARSSSHHASRPRPNRNPKDHRRRKTTATRYRTRLRNLRQPGRSRS